MFFKRLILPALLLAYWLLPLPARAATVADHVVISELQTGTTASASQEFVELYNPTDSDVALDNWTVEYKSATGSSWSKKATLTGIIVSHGFYLVAPKTYLSQADASLSAGLAASGGHVRLMNTTGSQIDLLGWGTATAAATAPAQAPPAGQSLERLPGRLVEDGGNATDSGDNSQDFIIRTAPQPQSTAAPLETPDSGNATADDNTQPATDPAPQPQTYQPVSITELLVDPVSPLTDAKDEFIELYNPNSAAINLKGYTLRTGANFHDFYIFPDTTINAGAYLAVYSSQTKLSLTNSGGAAQLLDPTGVVVSQTDDYTDTPPGSSWSNFADGWQWTLQTTPGTGNIAVQPLLKVPAPPGSSSAAAAKPKTVTSKSAKAATTAKSATAKLAKASGSTVNPVAPLVQLTASPLSKWLLIGAGAFTLAYGIYEFRHDLQNYFFLVRRYVSTRRKIRPSA